MQIWSPERSADIRFSDSFIQRIQNELSEQMNKKLKVVFVRNSLFTLYPCLIAFRALEFCIEARFKVLIRSINDVGLSFWKP